jgi:hypothetical protein
MNESLRDRFAGALLGTACSTGDKSPVCALESPVNRAGAGTSRGFQPGSPVKNAALYCNESS